jgi:hypothetical protein
MGWQQSGGCKLPRCATRRGKCGADSTLSFWPPTIDARPPHKHRKIVAYVSDLITHQHTFMRHTIHAFARHFSIALRSRKAAPVRVASGSQFHTNRMVQSLHTQKCIHISIYILCFFTSALGKPLASSHTLACPVQSQDPSQDLQEILRCRNPGYRQR